MSADCCNPYSGTGGSGGGGGGGAGTPRTEQINASDANDQPDPLASNFAAPSINGTSCTVLSENNAGDIFCSYGLRPLIGDEITKVTAYVRNGEANGDTVFMKVYRSNMTTGVITQLGATQTSPTGANAYHTLALSGLTETVAAGSSYVVEIYSTAAGEDVTAGESLGIEYDLNGGGGGPVGSNPTWISFGIQGPIGAGAPGNFTYYATPGGIGSASTDEIFAEAGEAFTAIGMQLFLTGESKAGPLTVTLRINGVDTALTATIDAFSNSASVTGSVAVAPDDLYSFSVVGVGVSDYPTNLVGQLYYE